MEGKQYPPAFYIKGEVKGKLIRIETASINYIEAAHNYVIIHTAREKHMTYLTMRDMIAFLDPAVFVRVHRSYIVNSEKIYWIGGGKVVLQDQTMVMMGTKYAAELLQRLQPLVISSER
jgi:DNA-binding LytR/AlgR family response regulator